MKKIFFSYVSIFLLSISCFEQAYTAKKQVPRCPSSSEDDGVPGRSCPIHQESDHEEVGHGPLATLLQTMSLHQKENQMESSEVEGSEVSHYSKKSGYDADRSAYDSGRSSPGSVVRLLRVGEHVSLPGSVAGSQKSLRSQESQGIGAHSRSRSANSSARVSEREQKPLAEEIMLAVGASGQEQKSFSDVMQEHKEDQSYETSHSRRRMSQNLSGFASALRSGSASGNMSVENSPVRRGRSQHLPTLQEGHLDLSRLERPRSAQEIVRASAPPVKGHGIVHSSSARELQGPGDNPYDLSHLRGPVRLHDEKLVIKQDVKGININEGMEALEQLPQALQLKVEAMLTILLKQYSTRNHNVYLLACNIFQDVISQDIAQQFKQKTHTSIDDCMKYRIGQACMLINCEEIQQDYAQETELLRNLLIFMFSDERFQDTIAVNALKKVLKKLVGDDASEENDEEEDEEGAKL